MEYFKLEECCEILDSKRIPITEKDRVPGNIPYYGANGIQDYVNDYIFDDELVLLAEDGGNFGSKTRPIAYRVSGKCWVNNHAHVLKPKSIVDVDFLCYSLMFYNVDSIINGATRKKLTQSAMREMKIPKLILNKQLGIVKRLKTIEKIIDHRKQQLEQLDLLTKSRFVEMFGDPETNPLGWRQAMLNDVCSSIVRGPFGSALKKEYFVEPNETTYKVYEQKHAIQKAVDIGTYYISSEKFKELRRFECKSGDILMSCSGTLGELYQLPDNCEKGIINQALCKFTLNEKISPAVFLEYMEQTIGNLETKGSGIKNIGAVSYVKAMQIYLPPIELQNKFAQFVEQVEKSKTQVQKSLDEAQLLFNRLMQEYFE